MLNSEGKASTVERAKKSTKGRRQKKLRKKSYGKQRALKEIIIALHCRRFLQELSEGIFPTEKVSGCKDSDKDTFSRLVCAACEAGSHSRRRRLSFAFFVVINLSVPPTRCFPFLRPLATSKTKWKQLHTLSLTGVVKRI